MDDIHLCKACGGGGLKPFHPQADAINKQMGAPVYSKTIFDVKAGKYTDKDTCIVCKGSGYDPQKHPDRVREYTSRKV